MHLRFVSVDKKIRAISSAFLGSFFARTSIRIIYNFKSISSEKSYHNKTHAEISHF